MVGGSCISRGCGASALERVQRATAQKGREEGGVEDTGAPLKRVVGRKGRREGGKVKCVNEVNVARENHSWKNSQDSLGRSNMNHVSGLVISWRETAKAMHVKYLDDTRKLEVMRMRECIAMMWERRCVDRHSVALSDVVADCGVVVNAPSGVTNCRCVLRQ